MTSHESVKFPTIQFYDQDFINIYNQTWLWIEDYTKEIEINGVPTKLIHHPGASTINSLDACFSTFFLVYSNKIYSASTQLDFFYSKQESNGAIRNEYSFPKLKPVFTRENPQGLGLPLFAWAEYNLYHKTGGKKRIHDIMPTLEKYYNWLESNFRDTTGLYHSPLAATGMINSPREGAKYYLDFNLTQTINAYYMSELGDLLNDRDISFNYRRRYYALKTQINQKMWNNEKGFYFDLDKKLNQLNVKSIAAYWSLLARLPSESRFELLLSELKNPKGFATTNQFPTLPASHPAFKKEGEGYRGSVFPYLNYMVIKGLDIYSVPDFARTVSMNHLYCILDTYHSEAGQAGNVYEAYKPNLEGPATWHGNDGFPKPMHLSHIGLVTISLMIENILGLSISLPRKTVSWVLPSIESMGIEYLALRRNHITILIHKCPRGWEIKLESEKLYYFTIDIPQIKKKTLPIPSGKCSMLIDKL